MKILITLSNFGLGGTESYSATIAEGLEKLGHEVTLHAPQANDLGREMAAARGLVLRTGEIPPEGDDAVIAQDLASAQLLAGRNPAPRQIFAIHGLAPFEHPPRGLDPAPTVVVFNDRTGRHAAALAESPPVARLRQPIDITQFRPRTAAPPRARRLLVLSNTIGAGRMRILEAVCEDLGLELARVGADAPTITPQEDITEADIVIGYGRSILEGMAMGRPAYVWERAGGDGWVTPESYAAFESDGFSGGSDDAVIDADRLRADLAAYRPELGEYGYDLIRKHHSAAAHTEQLVDLLEKSGEPRRQEGAETISLLVRAERRAVLRVEGAERTHGQLLERISGLEGRIHDLGIESDELRRELHGTVGRVEEERRGREAAESRLAEALGSLTWRLAEPIRRFVAWARAH